MYNMKQEIGFLQKTLEFIRKLIRLFINKMPLSSINYARDTSILINIKKTSDVASWFSLENDILKLHNSELKCCNDLKKHIS